MSCTTSNTETIHKDWLLPYYPSLGSREVEPSVQLILACFSGTSCLVHKVLLHSTLLCRMKKPPFSVLHFYALLVHLQDIQHTQRHGILSEYPLHSRSGMSLWCRTDACWIHSTFKLALPEAQPLWCTIHISCTFSLLQASLSSCITYTAPSLILPVQCPASNIASDTQAFPLQISTLSDLQVSELLCLFNRMHQHQSRLCWHVVATVPKLKLILIALR